MAVAGILCSQRRKKLRGSDSYVEGDFMDVTEIFGEHKHDSYIS